MKSTTLILIVIAFLSISNKSNAIIAHPQPREYSLPNGTKLSIQLHGDEHFNWVTTLDGYRIIQNNKGYFVYASSLKSGHLESSEIKVSNITSRTSKEIEYIKTLEKNIGVKEQATTLKTQTRLKDAVAKAPFPSLGARKNLLILATFSDKTTTYTQADFNDLMNQTNPKYKNIGSFKDFYLEDSHGLFDITTTVTVWVTVPKSRLYYGPESKWAEFAYDAIKAADATVDFSQFEKNGTSLYGVTIIHQGMGQETSGNVNDIWSHQGQLSSYKPFATSRTFDGVVIDEYSMQPEIFDNTNSISGMGVITHEFGHLLGLPDFYDVDYSGSGGNYAGTGVWDLMAAGAYNGSYNTQYPYMQEAASPSHNNPLSKEYLHWATPIKINSPQSLTLNPILSGYSFYKIATSSPKEYFYLENRQQSGFDSQLPGHGMLIYHVDSTWIDQHTSNNDINVGTHQGLYFKIASGGVTNSEGCPFPGIGNITNITDVTTPNMLSWLGTNTNKSITNIEENIGGNITFDFMAIQNGAPQAFEAKPYTENENRLFWTPSTTLAPVLIAVSTSATIGNPTNGTTYSTSDPIPGGGNVLYSGSSTSMSNTLLNPNTTYYYKIWSNNSTNYSEALTSHTTTADTVLIPWLEPIKNNLNLWKKEWVSGTNTQWTAKNGGYYDRPSPVKITLPDTTVAAICQQDAGNSKSRLISKTFIPENGFPYRLSFKLSQAAYKIDQDTLQILIKPMLAANWTTIATIKENLPNWTYQDFDLPNINEPFQIAFENSSYNGYGIAIDSVEVNQIAPLTPINHTITITNGVLPISNASVTLLGETTLTNASGVAQFNSKKPSRNLELVDVNAPGYEENITKVDAAQSINRTIELIKSEAITPTNISAQRNYKAINLSWNPVIDESFESYSPWGTKKIGAWLLKDFDKDISGGYSSFDYPNNIDTCSFLVFDCTYGGMPNNFTPHSGKQMAVAPFSYSPPNNDWIISPQITITNGDYLELFAKSATDLYGLETMRVLISESTPDVGNFVTLHPEPSIEVPAVWSSFTYDLSAYSGKKIYFAINCVSNDKYALLIDDIKIKNINTASYLPETPTADSHTATPDSTGNIEYQILRAGTVIATLNGFEKTAYTDNLSSCITTNYSIQTNYITPAKKSLKATEINITACREVTIVTKDANDISIGSTVKLDGNSLTTNASGEAFYDGVADGSHSLNIVSMGYNTINETLNITKDSIVVRVLNLLTTIPQEPFNNVKISPTINNGNFTLTNIDLPVPFNWSVYSIDGSLIQIGEIIKLGDTEISINKPTKGTYILKMYLSDETATQKIIIQ